MSLSAVIALLAVVWFIVLSITIVLERRSAEDQGKLPVTKLETVKTTFALFWVTEEHQFWLCEDKGDDLVCHRSCGGVQDVECPTASSTEGAFTTHTR